MRVTSKALCSLWFIASTSALHREDAGLLDFTLVTSGHGVTKHVGVHGDSILTTDDSSCYVASRSIANGSLLWRRNVCGRKGSEHSLAFTDTVFFTMDSSGLARSWDKATGALLWDTQMKGNGKSGVWAVGGEYVLVSTEGEIFILKAKDGSIVDRISFVKGLNQKLKSGETPQVLSVVSEDGSHMQGVIAYVQEDGTSNRIWSVNMQVGNDEFLSIKSIHLDSLVVSSLETYFTQGSFYGLGVTTSGNAAIFSLEGKTDVIDASSWSESWVKVVAVRPTNNDFAIAVHGIDGEGKNGMRLYEGFGSRWRPLNGSPVNGVVAYCRAAKLVVEMGSDSLAAFIASSSPTPMSGDVFLSDGNFVENLSVLECTTDSLGVLLSTSGGTTTQVSFSVASTSVSTKVRWSAEEGLASISSAVMLDASHMGSNDSSEEKDIISNRLSVSSRLSAQAESLLSLFSLGSSSAGGFSARDHTFGFVKVAALLSQKNHRMWGLETSGPNRGSMRWSLDLPNTALWHTMVHGTTNSPAAFHGINGGTHSREILVISAASDFVEWKCIDGASGAVHAASTSTVTSPVSQVIPIYGSTGSCHQASLLLHEDRSVSMIPGDSETFALIKEQLTRASNGMYTHVVDKVMSTVESYQVAAGPDSTFVSHLVGRSSFAGERVVKVAYPIRDEMVQTMSTILGDNALLLKYINPHLAVVITTTDAASKTSIATSLEKASGKTPKRKPAGVGDTATAETKPEDSMANLFVNLVDTVSGRILYRTSHANADTDHDVTALISENWVLYSFVNSKTRRTELGVLTLHEGMIDPKGIGMFSSPEHATSFSSFDVRESKPVVLSKTYVFPKRVTALGVTATRGGISSRNILIASDDGKIASVNRPLLETRRPMGELKDAEKKEGLYPYSELIVQMPQSVLSYNHTLEAVASIVSVPTALESQSLVLAFGGPDLFFTRTSPSKGFDLLPDSFSRVLVSIVTAGLVVVLFVIKRMGSQKALKNNWL